MAILNYTTTVAAEKTAAEIIGKLAAKGARRVTQEFGAGGVVTGIAFSYEVGGIPVYFKLPANEAGVEKHLLARRKGFVSQKQREEVKAQARRVAWRILKDWIEAQIALVESQQAEMAQVFLPYAQDDSGQTVFQHFLENNQKRLAAGN